MGDTAILYPMFGLAAWTAVVLTLIPFARIGAAKRREVRAADFLYGESANVPGAVSIPNRNYMNLLEMPMLFYVVCLIAYVTGASSLLAVYLAWAFVAARVVHSAIHLTYNKIMHRLSAFAVSNFLLVVLWVVVAIRLADRGQS